MALLDTVKQKLGLMTPSGAIAADIPAAIYRAMAEQKKIFRDQTLVPGHYRIMLAREEYLQLKPILIPFCQELEEAVLEMAAKKNYQLDENAIRVELTGDRSIPSGELTVTALFTEKEDMEPSLSSSLFISPGTNRVEQYPLEPGEYLLGRGREADFFPMVEDALMSRGHCLLVVEKGAIFLQDLESSNGIIINGKKCSGRIELFPGVCFLLGNTEFEVRG